MTKYTLDEVNDMYVDVLKEIGNVGSGNAATAIANMVGTRIDMKVPNVKIDGRRKIRKCDRTGRRDGDRYFFLRYRMILMEA